MPRAVWNGTVLAEAPQDEVEIVEGNVYFPPSSLTMGYLQENESTSVCPWKGKANYYDVVVDGESIAGAAWTYHEPSAAAKQIKDYVAFWKGVEVER